MIHTLTAAHSLSSAGRSATAASRLSILPPRPLCSILPAPRSWPRARRRRLPLTLPGIPAVPGEIFAGAPSTTQEDTDA